jgi:hypothetical protein
MYDTVVLPYDILSPYFVTKESVVALRY